jgi:putative spermidine/putrescine transport system substrate-binding protein
MVLRRRIALAKAGAARVWRSTAFQVLQVRATTTLSDTVEQDGILIKSLTRDPVMFIRQRYDGLAPGTSLQDLCAGEYEMKKECGLTMRFRNGSLVAMAFLVPAALLGGGSWVSVLAAPKPTTITLFDSGDVNIENMWQNQLIPLFEREHPTIKVNLIYSTSGSSNTTMFDRIAAAEAAHKNSGIDITGSNITPEAAEAHLLETVTAKNIPNIRHVAPRWLKQTLEQGVPYRGSSVVIAYNSTFIKSPPKTLQGVVQWIHAHPGKFTYNTPSSGGSGQGFVQGVLNYYVPKKDEGIFTTGYQPALESTWTKGLNTLKALSPDIYRGGFYPNGNVAVLELLANSSIWMAPVWSDMSTSYKAKGLLPPSIKLEQLTPPLNGGPAYVGVVKNSPHLVQDNIFVNWLLTPAVQTIVVHSVDGYPGVEWKYMPSTVKSQFGAIATEYSEYWSSKFTTDLNSKWQADVASR